MSSCICAHAKKSNGNLTKVAKYPSASHYKTQAFSSLGMLNNSDHEAKVNIKLYDYVIKHNGDMTVGHDHYHYYMTSVLFQVTFSPVDFA